MLPHLTEWQTVKEALHQREQIEPSLVEAIDVLDAFMSLSRPGNTKRNITRAKEQVDQIVRPLMELLGYSSPLLHELILLVGRAYRTLGEFELAQEWYAQFVNSNGNDLPTLVRAEILKQLGHVASMRCEWDAAEDFYTRSFVLFEADQCHDEVADIYNSLGYNAIQQGNLEQASMLHKRALNSIQEDSNPLTSADAHNSLAVIASIRADWDRAIDEFEASLADYEETGNSKGMAQTYQNLAMAYVDCEEWEAAGKCYEAATELAEEHGDISLMAVIYVNRAEFLVGLSNIGPAQTYCNRAMSLFRQMDDSLGIAECYKLLGPIARRKREWEITSECFRESATLFETSNNP